MLLKGELKGVEVHQNWARRLTIFFAYLTGKVVLCKLGPISDEEPSHVAFSFEQFATSPVSDENLLQKKPTKKRYIVKHHGRKSKVQHDAALVSGNVIMEMGESDDDPESGVSIVEFDTDTEAQMFKGLGYMHNDIEEDPLRSLQRLSSSARQHPKHFKPPSPYNLNLSREAQRHLLTAAQIVPYGLRRIFQDKIPEKSYYPSKITHPLCIIDSGFDDAHPDLSNISVTSGDGKSTEDCEGDWHGTHVAGTVVAEDNNLGILGVFPGAPILVVKVFGGNNCRWNYQNDVYASDLIEAARNCIERGAKILSMSLGGSVDSGYEEKQFKAIADELGVISVAAAGNSYNSDFSYPASYSSCVSVAATDERNEKADFSTFNSEVDLSAPGVAVLSTVGEESIFAISVGGTTAYPILYMEFSATVTDDVPLVGEACLCSTLECPSSCKSKICLIPRGDVSFKNKGLFCEDQGGIGAVIYNYEDLDFIKGTLGDNSVGIPVFETSGVLGFDMIKQNLSDEWRVDGGSGLQYDFFSGTSMATPHVSGAVYLLWNKYPQCTNVEIREALERTALNLGEDNGRDNAYGHGLIQYWAAAEYLDELGCHSQESETPSLSPSSTPSSSPSSSFVPSVKPSDEPSGHPSLSSVPSITPSMSLEPTETTVQEVYLAMIEYSIEDKSVNLDLWLSHEVENASISVTVYKKNRIKDTLELSTDKDGKATKTLDKAKKNDNWLVQITNLSLPKGNSDGREFVYNPKKNMVDPGYTVPGGRQRKDI